MSPPSPEGPLSGRMDMGKLRVYLTFPSDLIQEPIIYQLGKNFDIVTNIRRADVTPNYGWVALEMEGKDEDLERAVTWLKEKGIMVDPIDRDVVIP